MDDEDTLSLALLLPKNEAAVELGRRGGKKGSAARAARMTSEARAESSRLAARARWAKPPKAIADTTAGIAKDPASLPASPFAKFRGEIALGGVPMECYVLDTGERVLSMRAIVKAIAGTDSGNLGEYLSIQGLKDFIDKELVVGETKEFNIPGNPIASRGLPAEAVIDIMKAYVSALQQKKLTTERQREIAVQCSVLLIACAKTGLIALIDEATGYQYERAEDALRVKIQAYVAEELRDWEKTFPDELWEQFGRLTKWKGPLHIRPKWWGHLVNELIYEALDPDVAKYLRENKPRPYHGQNYHQWLSEDVGLKALIPHIYKVIGMAEGCSDMREMRDKVAARYGRRLVQLTMSLPPKADPQPPSHTDNA